jgi:hypothetical protein
VTAHAGLLRALGPRLLHVTARSNAESIERLGLWPPATLAERAGVDPASIVLRRERVQLSLPDGTARLNHQRPILHGLEAANRIVDNHDARTWAMQLDRRVFFWPERPGDRFLESISRDVDVAVLVFDTARFLAMVGARSDLSPINSGNFTRGGARAVRGDWLYVPVAEGLGAFRDNRRKRGLVRAPDAIREVSVRGGIDAETLNHLRVS